MKFSKKEELKKILNKKTKKNLKLKKFISKICNNKSVVFIKSRLYF